MRDETAPRAERMEAAAKAAPYVHARLAAIEYTSPIPDKPPIDVSVLTREQREALLEVLRRRQELQLEAAGTEYVLDNDRDRGSQRSSPTSGLRPG